MLKGKTAVITGSTSGIGLGIAHGFAQAGANIVINGFRPPETMKETIAEMAATYGVKVTISCGDLTDPAICEGLITHALEEHGQVDILVNNAGMQYVAPIEEFPPEKWSMILALNLTAAYHTIRHALPDMRKRNWGRIINVASAHGLVASPYKSAYVASKHAIVGLTKVIALETAEDGITCNTICPGYVLTPLVEKQIADQAKSHGISEDEVVRDVLLKAQPNKQFAQVEEVAALATFLASDNGRSVTGSQFSIDGGWTAQ